MHRLLSSLQTPTEYVQVANVGTLSGFTKVWLAVTQVNMVKTPQVPVSVVTEESRLLNAEKSKEVFRVL